MNQDRKKQLEDNVTRGLEAQHFLQMMDNQQYFKDLFAKMDNEYVTAILGLAPDKLEEFRLIQTKRMALYEPFSRAQYDVAVGQQSAKELEDGGAEGGIL